MIEIKNIQGEVIAQVDGDNLMFANMWGKDFRGACLNGENLAFACLFEAKLEGADLRGANLCNAGVDYSQLELAITDGTTHLPDEVEFCHI